MVKQNSLETLEVREYLLNITGNYKNCLIVYILNKSTQEILPTLRGEAPNNWVKYKIVVEVL